MNLPQGAFITEQLGLERINGRLFCLNCGQPVLSAKPHVSFAFHVCPNNSTGAIYGAIMTIDEMLEMNEYQLSPQYTWHIPGRLMEFPIVEASQVKSAIKRGYIKSSIGIQIEVSTKTNPAKILQTNLIANE